MDQDPEVNLPEDCRYRAIWTSEDLEDPRSIAQIP